MMPAPAEEFPDLQRWTERRPAATVALRLIGLLVVGVALVRSGQRTAWPLAAVAIAAGAVWTVAASRRHGAATAAAIVFGLCGAAMTGSWGEPVGLALVFVCMLYLQASVEPRVIALCVGGAILALGVSCALATGRASEVPWVVGVTLCGALLGDTRRSRMLALRRAQDLLVMTRRANAEQAHAAALAERGRIARDVHDVLAHSLSGLVLQLEAADALLSEGGDVDAAHTMVVRAKRLARDGLGEVRRAVAALREDVKPPEQTLARLAADYSAVTGWKAAFELEGGPVPALAVETAQGLQRVTQEALTNARKHAPGAAVEVRLTVGAGEITLTVENGAPTLPLSDPLAASGGGWGIVGLRERVQLLDGTLTAGPTECGGWRVAATVPSVQPVP